MKGLRERAVQPAPQAVWEVLREAEQSCVLFVKGGLIDEGMV